MAEGGPRVITVAGPNGAGKSTFAREFLPNEAGCPRFVNADLIAAGLSPFAPDLAAVRAARVMLAERPWSAWRCEWRRAATTCPSR